MLLTSTSDVVQVVTSAVANVVVVASWVDLLSGAASPNRTDTTAITSATTTTVVGSPAGSTQRRVRDLEITNNHATASVNVKVRHSDGTNANDVTPNVTLLPGESLDYDDMGRWVHLNRNGAPYPPVMPTIRPSLSGYLAETFPRELCPESNANIVASGGAAMTGIWLKAGTVVTNIIMASATQAAVTPSDWWFCLCSGTGQVLAQSADQTTTAWAARTPLSIAMVTPYTIPKDGVYYLCYVFNGGTAAGLCSITKAATSTFSLLQPVQAGASATTGITTALPNQLLLPTAGVNTGIPWAAVS